MGKAVDEGDSLVGRRLGEFEIVSVIGRGGMSATVYRAYQASLDRFVALKALPPGGQGDRDFAERFAREARAAAAVTHPNIIEVYAFGQEGPYRYIAMELVDGGSLAHLLRREGRLSPVRTLRIIEQVAAALAKAHAAGVLHRDIKPSNILVASDDLVKVADFGLAKRAGLDASVTLPGDAVGTPHYMSPEAVRAAELDERSDLYSLGATAYHLLTGRPLYAGLSSHEVMARQLAHPPVPVSEIAPHVPPALCHIVHRLLRKNPADRFSSAPALLVALGRVGLVPPAGPPRVDTGVPVQRARESTSQGPSAIAWRQLPALLRGLAVRWPMETAAAALAAILLLGFLLLLAASPDVKPEPSPNGEAEPITTEPPERKPAQPKTRLQIRRVQPESPGEAGSSALPSDDRGPHPTPPPKPILLPPRPPSGSTIPDISIPEPPPAVPVESALIKGGPAEWRREYEAACRGTYYEASCWNASIPDFGGMLSTITGMNVIADPRCSQRRRALRTVTIRVRDASLDFLLAQSMHAAHCAAGIMDYAIYIAPSLDDVRDAQMVQLVGREGIGGDLAVKLRKRLSTFRSDATLAQSVASLSASLGVNVDVAPECAAKPVTLRVSDMPAESILLWLARLTGSSLAYEDGRIRLAPAEAGNEAP